jgi:RNA polymerase sigma factor (sigma-70 family)
MTDRRPFRSDSPSASLEPVGGDASAPRARLAHWFDQWRKPLNRWLLRRSAVPAVDVDDLAQEVFLRLLRYSDDVAVTNPQGYLFRIAANVANEWQERVRNRQPHDPSWLAELKVGQGEEPENAVGRDLTGERVRAIVQRLPPRQREILLLHIDDDLTCAQIAQRLQVSRRIVQRDLAQAYSRLRLRLNLDDLGSLSGS